MFYITSYRKKHEWAFDQPNIFAFLVKLDYGAHLVSDSQSLYEPNKKNVKTQNTEKI